MTTDTHKAAVLLLSLPRRQAARLLGALDPAEIAAVTGEIARCERVSAEEQRAVLHAFTEDKPAALVGHELTGPAAAQALLDETLCDDPAALERIRSRVQAAPFRFLDGADAVTLLELLREEHPQTIALVLAHLSRSLAADVLAALPEALQGSVVQRMAGMGATRPDVIAEVADVLKARIERIPARGFSRLGGVGRVAEILNAGNRAAGYNVLENLAADDPDLAAEIREGLFAFHDLLRFSDADLQALLKSVDATAWPVALHGAPRSLVNRTLANLPQRAATKLRAALAEQRETRPQDVQTARRQIVDVMRRLEESGAITIDSAPRVDAVLF